MPQRTLISLSTDRYLAPEGGPLAEQAGVSMDQLVAMSNLLGKSAITDELTMAFSR